MKRFVLLLVLTLGASAASAQDILTFKDGHTEDVRVLTISGSEVRYRDYNNPNGPERSEKRDNLYSIKLENGKFMKMKESQGKYYTYSEGKGERKFTGQADFYIQDGWGIGYMLRRELNKYAGWNIFGTSFMSGWNNPRETGLVNVRAMGLRLNTPDFDGIKLFAEVTPGYSFVYLNKLYMLSWHNVAEAHFFGLDFSAGFQIKNKVLIGYNLNYMTNSNGSDMSHWGRISVLF
jgi:hypothetical protein